MAYKRSKTNLKILVTLQSLAFGSRSDWINFHMISFVMGIMHHTILFFFLVAFPLKYIHFYNQGRRHSWTLGGNDSS